MKHKSDSKINAAVAYDLGDYITPHFRLREFVRSQTAARHGIDNTPPVEHLGNIFQLADKLEMLREHVGPVFITSGYRCPELNRLVGGSPKSAHMEGRAADIVTIGLSPEGLFDTIKRTGIPFDKTILEFGEWVHVQIPKPGNEPRRKFYVAERSGGRVVYKEVTDNHEA